MKLGFHRLDIFGQCSGLKLNKSKTEIIALGRHWDKQKLNQIKKGPFKVLDVWFSENDDSYKIDGIMKTWPKFSISIKGKKM